MDDTINNYGFSFSTILPHKLSRGLQILNDKLQFQLGIQLPDRTQGVRIGSETSSLIISIDAPQGCVITLSCTLF